VGRDPAPVPPFRSSAGALAPANGAGRGQAFSAPFYLCCHRGPGGPGAPARPPLPAMSPVCAALPLGLRLNLRLGCRQSRCGWGWPSGRSATEHCFQPSRPIRLSRARPPRNAGARPRPRETPALSGEKGRHVGGGRRRRAGKVTAEKGHSRASTLPVPVPPALPGRHSVPRAPPPWLLLSGACPEGPSTSDMK
jgi:hypothetical protein